MKTTQTTRKYSVSNTTSSLLDCLTSINDLYSQITDALMLRYPKMVEDDAEYQEKTSKYLDSIQSLIDLVHKEIEGQIIDNLGMDTKNSHSQTPVI